MGISLKNKPLVEVIFEMRWEIPEQKQGINTDTSYKILIGTLFQNVKDKFSYIETLPASSIPDQLSNYLVQYRYRSSKDRWPLIQIGPGIITFNDTEGYTWEDFQRGISYLVENFFSVYPEIAKININDVKIRYIDSIEFDYESSNILEFLNDKLKTNIKLNCSLFEGTQVDKQPLALDINSVFKTEKPPGIISLRFARGKRSGKDILLWETTVQSIRDDAPKNREDIHAWLEKAHWLTDDWFFKLIEGDLHKRFE